MSEWISVKDKLPEKSGEYLCAFKGIEIYYYMVINFSTKHKAFNVWDEQIDIDDMALYPDYWMLIPEVSKGGADNGRG